MAHAHVNTALTQLSDAELEAVARVAERLLAGRPLYDPGPRPVQRRAGAGLEFLDYRGYVAGDDLRSIDWRATSRSRRIQVRRYHEEASSDWMICVDRSASMTTSGGDKWQLGTQLAAAMAYVLLSLSNRVGLTLFSDRVDGVCPLGRGHQHYARVLETLVAHPPRERGGASDLAVCTRTVKPGASLVVISDLLATDAMQSGLVRLARKTGPVHAFRVSSQGDFSLDAEGPLTLVDAESGQELSVVADAALTEASAAAWREQQTQLMDYCARAGIHLTVAGTEQTWKEVVLTHLTGLGGRRA